MKVIQQHHIRSMQLSFDDLGEEPRTGVIAKKP